MRRKIDSRSFRAVRYCNRRSIASFVVVVLLQVFSVHFCAHEKRYFADALFK